MISSCPKCDALTEYDPTALRMSPFASLVCHVCGDRFTPKPPKRGRSDAQRRSQQQEKQAARRYGGQTQPGSGSSSRAKGDIRDPGVLRGECKETVKRSFSLRLEELMKIEKEAAVGEMPLFEVQFQGVHPFKTYVVLPAKEYQCLMEELEDLRNRTTKERHTG